MASLTAEQLDHFDRFGFLAVERVFDPEEVIVPVMDEYARVLDTLAEELCERGTISQTYADLPFAERICRVYVESQRVHAQYFDFSLPQTGIKVDTPFWAGPAVFAALTNPSLLDVVEAFIGPRSTPTRSSTCGSRRLSRSLPAMPMAT